MTLTPSLLAQLHAFTVPADSLAGVLEDWIGPCRVPFNGRRMAGVVADTSGEGGIGILLLATNRQVWVPNSSLGRITLEMDRPESRLQVATVLGRGERCDNCAGNGRTEPGVDCARCTARGYLRLPSPVRHLLDGPLGDLPAEMAGHSAELIACSVARVLVGLGPVAGVLEEWREDRWTWYRDGLEGHQRVWVFKTREGVEPDGNGWALGRPTKRGPRGPETGALGKSAADRASLAAGFAYVEGGMLVAPWPEASNG